MLLSLGVDLHVDHVGAICMHSAIMGRNTQVIEFLLSHDFKVP